MLALLKKVEILTAPDRDLHRYRTQGAQIGKWRRELFEADDIIPFYSQTRKGQSSDLYGLILTIQDFLLCDTTATLIGNEFQISAWHGSYLFECLS